MDVDSVLKQRLSAVRYTHRFYEILNGVGAELSEEALQYVSFFYLKRYSTEQVKQHGKQPFFSVERYCLLL